MNPWSDPNSYAPELAGPNWWERNRARVVVLAVILVIGVLALTVPESLR